jgi:hypothetical protein
MSYSPVDRGERIDNPGNGPMRDESGQLPNFTDHLTTTSRDPTLKCRESSRTIVGANMRLKQQNVNATEVVNR